MRAQAQRKASCAISWGVIADVDAATRAVVLTIHWRGGDLDSQSRIRKPKSASMGAARPSRRLQ
jgi:hypothetical protein